MYRITEVLFAAASITTMGSSVFEGCGNLATIDLKVILQAHFFGVSTF